MRAKDFLTASLSWLIPMQEIENRKEVNKNTDSNAGNRKPGGGKQKYAFLLEVCAYCALCPTM